MSSTPTASAPASAARESASRSPPPAIECRAVVKQFGSFVALDRISLEVPRGTILGLLGPNGAGKTTLLRILLGLTPLTGGSASVLGLPVPPRRLLPRIGYMPQNLGIYPDLTVEQNLRFLGRLEGLGAALLAERVDDVLALVELVGRRRSIVSQLSGGLQRRVSLAAALLAEPELLLLDEPTVGVDPELRAEFWEYFRRLARDGRTVVMTTHYMAEATECDRVAMIHAGRLVAYDAPERILKETGAATMDAAFLRLVRGGGADPGHP